jgi:hypothetical protein
MRIHSRWITLGIAAALLALVGASLVDAQHPQSRDTVPETAAVTPTDTLIRPSPKTDTASGSNQGAVGHRWDAEPTRP